MISAKPVKRSRFTAMVNGRKKAAKKAARKPGAPRRRNPAATVLLGYLNPEKKMARSKKKSKIRRVKRNPITAKAFTRKAAHRNHPRRRNPLNTKSLIGRPVELLKAGAIGAIAYFATRQVPQMVLKGRNAGWLGYLANLITALASSAAAARYFGPQAGTAAFVGGGMYLVGRVANDQTPYGKTLALSGVGDVAAIGGLGKIVPGYFASPAIVARDGSPVFQPQLTEHIKAQIPAAAPAAVGVAGGRFAAASRFSK